MQVSMAALPPYVSLATAESILFVGKAVRVLRQGSTSSSSVEPKHSLCDMSDVDARLHALQLAEELHPLEFEHVLESIRSKVLIWASRACAEVHHGGCTVLGILSMP